MSATFVAFEVVILALFIACFIQAWRHDRRRAWALGSAAAFGVLLEWATIQQLRAYSYGRFMLMLDEVPVAIGLAWGTIIYTARLTSDATTLPDWARPLLDGLLALNLDLAMDALAIRLGYWDWGNGLEQGYFGVPYANFWAWFWVVFFFSAGWRALERWPHPLAVWLAPVGAIGVGVTGVLATNWLITSGVSRAWYVPTVVLVLGGALSVVLALRPRLHARPVPAIAWMVPLVYHAFYLVVGLGTGVILQPVVLLWVSLAMLAVSLGVHVPVTAWARRPDRA